MWIEQACNQDEMGKGAIQNLEGAQGGCYLKILQASRKMITPTLISGKKSRPTFSPFHTPETRAEPRNSGPHYRILVWAPIRVTRFQQPSISQYVVSCADESCNPISRKTKNSPNNVLCRRDVHLAIDPERKVLET